MSLKQPGKEKIISLFSQHVQSPRMLQPLLDTLILKYDVTDLTIAIDRNNIELFSTNYGHCDAAKTQSITADTLFNVASLTKLVTAITILLLQDRGQLSVFDSVNHHYPTLKIASNPNLKLHHLLSHTSGWPGMASRFHAINLFAPDDHSGGIANSPGHDQSNTTKLHNADDLIAFMNHQPLYPLAEPGQLVNYSNEGYCLLGGIIEKVTGCRWQQTIRHEVLDPLCMSHSTIGLPNPMCFKAVAHPIVKNNQLRSAIGIWDAPLFYPAGGLAASSRDLLRLMTVLSADGPLLTPGSRAQLLTPVRSIASRSGADFGYSFGLEFRQFESGPIMHWHTGQRAGVSSLVATLPAHGLSMALLSNSSDAPLTAIAHQLIAEMVSACDPHWPTITDYPESQSPASDPCGHYATDEGFNYSVVQRDAVFYLCHGAETSEQVLHFQTATSGYVGQQTFAFLSEEGTPPQGCKPYTNRPYTDEPWALALDLRVLPRIS